MEAEKKKKRNKKKKSKQNKVTDDASSVGSEVASQDRSNVSDQNHQGQCSGSIDVRDKDVAQNTKHSGDLHASANGSVSVEDERQDWLQKEARLREMIKQLQLEKDLLIQREAGLEMRIVQLQSEKDSWNHKEAYLREQVRHLERDRAVWAEKENSAKEMVASLRDDNSRLQIQVMELEESRKDVSAQNQQLINDVSVLQSQILNIEKSLPTADSSAEKTKGGAADRDNLNSQIEAACALIEKLMAENAELVEKVNEMYIELDRWTRRNGFSSTVPDSVDSSVEGTIHDPVSDSSEVNTVSIEGVRPSETALKIVGDGSDHDYAAVARNSSETSVSGEIVQIPLDENEIRVEDPESQATVNEGSETEIPLTDAPLIGAPFRFISFVANYVSGADLVSENTATPEL